MRETEPEDRPLKNQGKKRKSRAREAEKYTKKKIKKSRTGLELSGFAFLGSVKGECCRKMSPNSSALGEMKEREQAKAGRREQ